MFYVVPTSSDCLLSANKKQCYVITLRLGQYIAGYGMILSFVLQYHDIKVVLMLFDKQNIICASVLLNVFNLLRKSNKMLGKASHFIPFP